MDEVDFVIITALEEERDAVLSKLPSYTKIPPTNEDIRFYFSSELPVCFSDGSTGTYSVIVLSLLKYGRKDALSATKDAINRWHPKYVLMVGIAGGFKENDSAIGDILVSSSVIDYELQKIKKKSEDFRYEEHQCNARLVGASQNFLDDWMSLISIKRPDDGKPTRRVGQVATGDKIVERPSLIKKLFKSWGKLIGVEMEAGGVATGCFQSPSPPGFFMIRGVSDLADENKETSEVKVWRSYACDIAAAYTIALLKSGPVPASKKKDQKLDKEIEEFRTYTNRVMEEIQLNIPGIKETLPRDEVGLVEDQLKLGRSVLLYGNSGTGKTGLGSMLISGARNNEKETLFLDARRIKDIKDEAELRKHLSLEEETSTAIERIGKQNGLRVVIDQLDSVVGLSSADVLVELAKALNKKPDVEVIVISRNREGHESKLIERLTSKDFYPIESHDLSEGTVLSILSELSIDTPSDDLLALAKNLLNLELIGRIKTEKKDFDFSNITDEVELWEKFSEVLTERESFGIKTVDPERLISDAVDLAKRGLLSEDGTFTIDFPLTPSLKRLDSWGIIKPVYGLVYRFGHEKLQDYFYAWHLTQKMAMPQDIVSDLGQHKARNILEWAKRIYKLKSPSLHLKFLEEVFNINV